ncbi:MAG: hypothetical protein EOR01_18615 [Mesorhizobium sp.]|nr:MAG: hypothetical protein EOR01_18615 [Mesorhizobium sp.]
MSSRKEPMENSVHQARWLLAAVFAVSITFLANGRWPGNRPDFDDWTKNEPRSAQLRPFLR